MLAMDNVPFPPSDFSKPIWWDRFWSKVAQDGDCKVWISARNEKGYGQFSLNGKNRVVHRLVYKLYYGPIPKGLSVCHQCDNPSCVEISHLFLGTPKDNMQDCVRKGRISIGESNGFSKLTKEIVKEIRRSEASHTELARRFNVHRQSVANVRNGKCWSHVP